MFLIIVDVNAHQMNFFLFLEIHFWCHEFIDDGFEQKKNVSKLTAKNRRKKNNSIKSMEKVINRHRMISSVALFPSLLQSLVLYRKQQIAIKKAIPMSSK